MPKGSDGAANASPPLCTCLGQGAAGGWRRERGARHFPGGCSGAAGPPAPPPTLSQQQAGACSHPSVCGHLNHGCQNASSAPRSCPRSIHGDAGLCLSEPAAREWMDRRTDRLSSSWLFSGSSGGLGYSGRWKWEHELPLCTAAGSPGGLQEQGSPP